MAFGFFFSGCCDVIPSAKVDGILCLMHLKLPRITPLQADEQAALFSPAKAWTVYRAKRVLFLLLIYLVDAAMDWRV